MAVFTGLGSAVAPSITFSADTNTGIFSPGADRVSITTGGVDRLTVDDGGRLLVGTSANRPSRLANNNYNSLFQIETTVDSGIAQSRFIDGVSATFLAFQKARGTKASPAAVINNDQTGTISFSGYDSANWTNTAIIQAEVDGTPGLDDMPGRIRFLTTAAGNFIPTERMRIDRAGTTTLTSGPITSPLITNIGASESFRVDSAGRLLVGTSANRPSRLANNNYNSLFQIETTVDSGVALSRFADEVSGTFIAFQKARGTKASPDPAVINDQTGAISFSGYDGANWTNTAIIQTEVDGTPGLDDMPGRIRFLTTAAGNFIPTERLRITSTGLIRIADAGHVAVGTTTGTKIGTATTQKLGFYNATPVVQPTAVANATDASSVIARLNDLLARMRALGLIAT
jgi:hypothetical protein